MEIQLTEQDGQHYADSRMIAGALGVEHHSIVALARKYEPEMGGILLFQTEVLSGPGQPAKYILLDERQSLFILTLVQNTEKARIAKMQLVDAFLALRKSNVIEFPKKLPSKAELAQWVIDAEKQIAEMQPIVAAHEALTDAHGAATIAQVGKVLGIGQKKLFARLRNDGILTANNLPYQQYMDQGYFIVKDKPIVKGNITELHKQTFVLPRGESWLAKKYGEPS